MSSGTCQLDSTTVPTTTSVSITVYFPPTHTIKEFGTIKEFCLIVGNNFHHASRGIRKTLCSPTLILDSPLLSMPLFPTPPPVTAGAAGGGGDASGGLGALMANLAHANGGSGME
jgi:hypothetical protein